MPVVKLTAFFKDDDGHGWSETHDKDGGAGTPNLTVLMSDFDLLMQTFRVPMLGGDAFYLGCRGSFKTATGATAGDNIERLPPVRGTQTFLGVNVNMGPPESSIKMRLKNAASTARSDVYIRGHWRQCVVAGVLDFSGPEGAQWKTRADAYAAELIAKGYGWQGTDPTSTSRGEVTNYTENPNGTVTLTLAVLNGVALPAAGTRQVFKFARINYSESILNQTLVCEVGPGAGQVTTLEQVAVSPFVAKGTYIATRTGIINYAALSYYRLSHRKTGRPFGVEPGRLPARVRH